MHDIARRKQALLFKPFHQNAAHAARANVERPFGVIKLAPALGVLQRVANAPADRRFDLAQWLENDFLRQLGRVAQRQCEVDIALNQVGHDARKNP